MNRARRALLWWIAALPPSFALAVEAPRRVGLIWNSPPDSEVQSSSRTSRHPGRRQIEERLGELGWATDRNLEIFSRSAEGRYERFPAIVDEMVARRVDVIVVFSREALRIAKVRAPNIPLVLSQGFNLPSGRNAEANVTGMAIPNPVAKRLELLKSLAPATLRVAMVARVAPGEAPPVISDALGDAMRQLGVEGFPLYFAEPEELEALFAEASRRGANALYMSGFPRLTWDADVQRRVIALAARHRLPAVYELHELARDGGLLGFGLDYREVHRKTADYVDRLLRGRLPAQLPREEPLRYILHVNARTARELGLSLPDSLRIQADRVFD
jgi:putative ABC transport system substrate-binding protein